MTPTITITEDGRQLRGGQWITPADYAGDEVGRGELPSLKGVTPAELPRLGGDQTGERITHFSRNDFPIS